MEGCAADPPAHQPVDRRGHPRAPTRRVSGRSELATAGAVALLGMALTTYGALAHVGPLVAPGSALILAGGGWLGNALARHDIRVIPTSVPATSATPTTPPEGRAP